MRSGVLLLFFLCGCAHCHCAIKRVVIHAAPCVTPAPPTEAQLAAAPGLIGRDAMLSDYVERARKTCPR